MVRRQWSDRGTAVATATALHVVVLLLIGFASPHLVVPPRLETETEPDTLVEVQLTPRIERPPVAPRPPKVRRPTPAHTPPREAPRPQTAESARPVPTPVTVPPAAPAVAPVPVPVREAQTAREKEKDRDKEKDKPQEVRQAETPRPPPLPPAPPAPAPPAVTTAASPVVAPSFRLPPGYGRQPEEASGGGLRGVLRATVGCAHEDYVHLTQAERDHCLAAFARDAGHGMAVDVVPADKRAAYDVEAAANARRRANKTGPLVSPVVACDGPGSNLGAGCLPPESHVTVKPQ